MQPIEEWARAHLWTFASTFSWLALTLFLGLRAQWREIERLLGGGGIRENTRDHAHEMLASGDGKPVPRQDPEDGFWYVQTFDPETGLPNGKRRVPEPSSPKLGNNARLGMFSR